MKKSTKQTPEQQLEAAQKRLGEIDKEISEEHQDVPPPELLAESKKLNKLIGRLEGEVEAKAAAESGAEEQHKAEMKRLNARLADFHTAKKMDTTVKRSEFNRTLGKALVGDGLMDKESGLVINPAAMTDEQFDKVAADVYAKMVKEGKLTEVVEALPSQDSPGDNNDNLPAPKVDGNESDLDKILSAIADPGKVVDLDAVNQGLAQKGESDVFTQIGKQMQDEKTAEESAVAAAA